MNVAVKNIINKIPENIFSISKTRSTYQKSKFHLLIH